MNQDSQMKFFSLVCTAAVTTLLLMGPDAAADTQEVTVVDEGACWIAEGAPQDWRVASFNDEKAFVLNPFRLEQELFPLLDVELRALGVTSFDATDVEIHLHCSSAGHALLVNLGNAGLPFCAHTDGDLRAVRVYPHFGGGSGACYGVEALSLVMLLNSPQDVAFVEALLEGPEYEDLIASIEPLTQLGILLVQLQPTHRFREDDARARLLQDPSLGSKLKAIEYNSLSRVAGSTVLLFAGEYGGF
ncbi:MAG: hypothetical protein NDI61_10440 [Bdellovibrionaceae bacterium]|nr:hypothetical protein [Pseudobdellovibrionaceae bacterium]